MLDKNKIKRIVRTYLVSLVLIPLSLNGDVGIVKAFAELGPPWWIGLMMKFDW